MKSFASDNYSGVHPEVMQALAAANVAHAPAYGDDAWTARLDDVMRGHLGDTAEVFPVFNGTGANVIGLQALLPRWGAVICASSAHINVDEGAAPERVGNLKLLQVDTPDGKLTPELVAEQAWGFGDVHRAQPLAVSISQTTEYGTCYTADEIAALAEYAHAHGMRLHVDGSRIANAAATLGLPLRSFTTDVGVDVLSLGGTKNGLMGAEAVVILNPEAASGTPFVRKFSMQLASKQRFLAAQLIALYEGDLWIRSARHANSLATRLSEALTRLGETTPGIEIVQPTQSNAVFARIPAEATARARESFAFYDWPGGDGEVRLMCSFDTTEPEVDELVARFADTPV